MLRGWNDFSPLFLLLVTFLEIGTPLGHEQTLQPQGLQEKRPNVPASHFKNNFRKNCRLLTKSHKNLNTMLSLCKYYIYYYIRGTLRWDDSTLALEPQGLQPSHESAHAKKEGHFKKTIKKCFFIAKSY